MKILFKLKPRVVVWMSAFVSIFVGLTYAEDEYAIFPAVFNLSDLNGKNGFIINGINPGDDSSGSSVSGTGDVNGDGIADILIGAAAVDNDRGQSYIVFGSKGSWPVNVYLNTLNGANGFVVNGINPKDFSGNFVSGAGDVNGDGIADILIGAIWANNDEGQTYVIFGSKKPWPAAFNPNTLNGTNGFIVNGINPGDFSGCVSEAGDVNGDGIADILIGAPDINNAAGQSYIIFGSKEQWPAMIKLAELNGDNGFAITGINPSDQSGTSISEAGDVNGDGIADILIGAPFAYHTTGQSYVVFGSKKSWPAAIYLAGLNGTNGFAINGINLGDGSGMSVSGAGDVNGDGIDDILIGAPYAFNRIGQSYILFGSKKPWSEAINLAHLNGNNGFTMTGINPNDQSGFSVSGLGDINGDGIADILIGAPGDRSLFSGQSYVVFGSKKSWPATINLIDLNGQNGFIINGINSSDSCGISVSGVGDVNGDGIADILISAQGQETQGYSYVIFGEHTSSMEP